ncbi:MAG TPA: ROK family protein [Acidimicrobiales bacterium]|nr:ROK family protein [Acidimicrobiales bacterium]
MAATHDLVLEEILAIDIGATSIKSCRVDHDGNLLEVRRRRPTPYPCTPERLVTILSDRIARSASTRVGVGFPGEFTEGRVVRPGNLARSGGVTSAVDPALEHRWEGFELQKVLCTVTGHDVRVVNDATLAALGCCADQGREIVFTLGTGFGLALSVDGEIQKVRDVGAEEFTEGLTYDQALGEHGRGLDEARWRVLLERAIIGFVAEFSADVVHLAGGNARRLSPGMFTSVSCPITIVGNEAALRGAARLFQD